MAALLLLVLLYVAFPYYQYYIDPDATAYLTIARRYAQGDWQTAINGYWNPWSCWLVGVLMYNGVADTVAMVVVNAAAAVGFIYISQSLFRRMQVLRGLQWVFNLTLAGFLCYAVFWQSFADLWGCLFLLCSLRLMLAERFTKSPLLWVLTGLVGALGYFAKAYALPFFVLHLLSCSCVIANAREKANRRQWLKMVLTILVVTAAISFIWVIFLHDRYHIWTTGTAGSLNMSWYLVGHPYWKEGIQHLLPPAYNGSVYYWEDPYVANGIAPHFWSSPRLFLLQGPRLVQNMLKFLSASNELSAFFLPAILIAAAIAFSKRIRASFPQGVRIVALSFLLFPLAYFLINFEARYLWYMLPLSMIFIALAWQRLAPLLPQVWLRRAVLTAIAASYLATPALGLKNMYKVGQDEHRIAQTLRAAGVTGSFTGNATQGPETQQLVRMAYLHGGLHYYLPVKGSSFAQVMTEAQQRQLGYYIHFTRPGDNPAQPMPDERGQPMPEVQLPPGAAFRVFRIAP